MRLGLIGCTGHWRSYASALPALPDLEIAGVAVAAPEERLDQYGGAPGVTEATRRYDSPEALLDSGVVDAVQVSTRSDLIPGLVRAALERRLPVMAEKPIAGTLKDLRTLYDLARRVSVPVAAMHAQRGTPLVAAVRDVVRAGAIGTPLLAHSQKSYRWGTSRPDALRSRATFPGVAPYIGIHVFDWLLWILGDRFLAVSGAESAAARPDYGACASHAAYLLRLSGEGLATVTLDYLRPEAAPTHGDERIRIVGTAGIVEVAVAPGTGTLTDARGVHQLDAPPALPWYADFLRSAARWSGATGTSGSDEPILPTWEVFRATEIALKAQQAVYTGRTASLDDTPYRPL
jgi:predicted dehydrogenase